MVCPVCGTETCAVVLILGLVKVSQCHCKQCGRAWREYALSKPDATILELSRAIDGLRSHRAVDRYPETAKHTIWFMESRIRALNFDDTEEGRQARKLDLWERQLVLSATQDDYLYS